jgi:hypothetical protein
MKQVCRSANPSLSSRDCSSKVAATDDRVYSGNHSANRDFVIGPSRACPSSSIVD